MNRPHHGEHRVYESVGSAVTAFSSAAASGQVTIEAAAAEDALNKITKVKDELITLLQGTSFGGGGWDVRLGANPVGQAMASKSVGRYEGSDSFTAALRLLLDETQKAEEALRRSIDNYIEIDDDFADNYGRQA